MSDLEAGVKKGETLPEIKAFIRTSLLDWRGRICPVIFLGRCNFRCPYCHNKELVLCPDSLPAISLQDVLDFVRRYDDWLDGIVISGGEPCLNPGLLDLIIDLRKQGLQIKLDTNGSKPDILGLLIQEGVVDYVSMDFKAPLNEFSYMRCTGVWSDVRAIERSIDMLLNGQVDYEFRVTIAPGLLNSSDLLSMAARIEGAKRFVLQNFMPHNTLDPSMEAISPYPREELEKIKKAISPLVKECLLISSD